MVVKLRRPAPKYDLFIAIVGGIITLYIWKNFGSLADMTISIVAILLGYLNSWFGVDVAAVSLDLLNTLYGMIVGILDTSLGFLTDLPSMIAEIYVFTSIHLFGILVILSIIIFLITIVWYYNDPWSKNQFEDNWFQILEYFEIENNDISKNSVVLLAPLSFVTLVFGILFFAIIIIFAPIALIISVLAPFFGIEITFLASFQALFVISLLSAASLILFVIIKEIYNQLYWYFYL